MVAEHKQTDIDDDIDLGIVDKELEPTRVIAIDAEENEVSRFDGFVRKETGKLTRGRKQWAAGFEYFGTFDERGLPDGLGLLRKEDSSAYGIFSHGVFKSGHMLYESGKKVLLVVHEYEGELFGELFQENSEEWTTGRFDMEDGELIQGLIFGEEEDSDIRP